MTLKIATRFFIALASGLIAIHSMSPAFAFDDKSASDQYEKVSAKERIYKLSFDEVWRLCNRAAIRTFENVRSDSDKGTLEMDSGTSLSKSAYHIVVSVERVWVTRTRVKLTTQKKRRFGWGSGDRLAADFFKAIDEQLSPAAVPEIKK